MTKYYILSCYPFFLHILHMDAIPHGQNDHNTKMYEHPSITLSLPIPYSSPSFKNESPQKNRGPSKEIRLLWLWCIDNAVSLQVAIPQAFVSEDYLVIICANENS